jgi:hypothetical protein
VEKLWRVMRTVWRMAYVVGFWWLVVVAVSQNMNANRTFRFHVQNMKANRNFCFHVPFSCSEEDEIEDFS